MKTLICLLIILCMVLPLTAQDDDVAIKETVLNYLEGWYEGNADRMEKALHPDLAKRMVTRIPTTGKTMLNYASASAMIEYTRAGFGKLPEDQWNISVEIKDIYKDIAQVKAVSAKFIDYCQVGKCDGEWKIIHVLWMPAAPPEPEEADDESRSRRDRK